MLLFFLYAFWILFNARITVEVALIGLPVTGLIYFFCLRLPGFSFRRDLALLKKFPSLVLFLLTLLGDVLFSALRVVRLIWTPGAPEPKLVSFSPALKTKTGRVLLSDSITLTPGTVTADLSGEELTVHCLEGKSADGLKDSAVLNRIRRLEEGDAHE